MSLLFLPDRHTFGQTSLWVTSKTGWGSPFLLIFCPESLPLIKREFTLIFHLPRGTDCWVCVQRGLETWREQTSLLTNHCQLSWGHQSLKPLLLWEKWLLLMCIFITILILVPSSLNGVMSAVGIWAFSGHSGEHLTWIHILFDRHLRKERELRFLRPNGQLCLISMQKPPKEILVRKVFH